MPTQTGKHGKDGSLKGKSSTEQPTLLTVPWPVKRPEWSELATIGALWATGWRLWPTHVWWIYATLPVAGFLIYLTRKYGMLRLQAAFPFVLAQIATWHGPMSLQHKATAGSLVLLYYAGHEVLAWLAIDRSGTSEDAADEGAADDGAAAEDGAESTADTADDDAVPAGRKAAMSAVPRIGVPKHSKKPAKKANGRRRPARDRAVAA
jgi:hypothetical protein